MPRKNKINLIGHLGKDVELKHLPTGQIVGKVTLAVGRIKRKDEEEAGTDWFNLVLWDKKAEYAAQWLGKGRLVDIEGRMESHSWVGEDGVKRTAWDITITQITALDKRGDDGASEGGVVEAKAAPVKAKK